MPFFEYEALDSNGRSVRGTVSGDSLDEAQQVIRGRGLNLQAIRTSGSVGDPLAAPPRGNASVTGVSYQGAVAAPPPARSAIDVGVTSRLVRRASLEDLQYLFRQMGLLLNAGVSPAQACRTLGSSAPNQRLRPVLFEMGDAADAGFPISKTMERYPDIFTPVMINTISAGEQGGFLVTACQNIARFIDSDIRIRRSINSATLMPKITIAASMVIIFLASLIIQLLAPGSPIKITSPLTEPRVLMVLVPLLIGIFLFVRLILPLRPVRRVFDQIFAALPGTGSIARMFAISKFSIAFAALYRSGVPIPRALELSADSTGNSFLQAQLRTAVPHLEAGRGIADSIGATGAMSPVAMDMLRTGEMTGDIDSLLENLSEYYEAEATYAALKAGKILGVVALVLVGAYVCYVLFNFYSGYFSALMTASGA